MLPFVADEIAFATARRSAFDAPPPCADESKVPGLFDKQLADKFHAWFGGSGRRYLTSVFPVDREVDGLGLPDFDGFVLLSAGVRGRTRRALAIAAIEVGRDRRRAMHEALVLGAEQWHVHLLGKTMVARAAIVADLALRQARANIALSA